ncbi:cytochrome C554 [bacterium]|nr:cytochrome C554 [bacterium]
MRKTLILVAATAIVLSAFAALAEEPTIIGVPKCKMCHKAKTGDQFKIWSESKHAGAFETLKSEAALAIATEKELGNPWEEPACLKCHTTQAFLGAELDAKTKYVDEEGVGCESCHGAGSAYKSKKVMSDHDAAVAAGLTVGGEETCLKCHNEDSPTFKAFDFEERWAEIAHPTLEAAE